MFTLKTIKLYTLKIKDKHLRPKKMMQQNDEFF